MLFDCIPVFIFGVLNADLEYEVYQQYIGHFTTEKKGYPTGT